MGGVMNALAFQEVALPNMLMVKFPRLTLEFRSGELGPSTPERNSKVSLGNFTMSMLGKATSWNARAFITPPIYLGPDDNTSSLETREQVDQLLRTCEHRISGWQSSGPARVMLYRYISIRGRYDTAGFSLPTLGPGEQKPLIAASETIAVSDHTKSVLRGTAQRMTLVP